MAEGQWVPIVIDDRTRDEFAKIMPDGRSLLGLHLNSEMSTMRITLDNGAEVFVPGPKAN